MLPRSTQQSTPNRRAAALFDGLAPRYDALGYLLSLGQDRRWRAAVVDRVVASHPRCVLDVATGTGGVAIELRRRSGAPVVGVDLTAEMLAVARGRLARRGEDRGPARVVLVRARAEQLPFRDACFDGCSLSYLFRYVADPWATLAELVRVVRPGAMLASLEFGVPPERVWRWLWRGYTRLGLPVLGALLGGREWFAVGRFLGPSIDGHDRSYPLERQLEAWRRCGLEQLQARRMSLGGGLVIFGVKSPAPTADGAEQLSRSR
jgi:demethylmenaquinone methyltransferase/2-methoxy-6-polyprenyl-1,4-benzoquinol methylase